MSAKDTESKPLLKLKDFREKIRKNLHVYINPFKRRWNFLGHVMNMKEQCMWHPLEGWQEKPLIEGKVVWFIIIPSTLCNGIHRVQGEPAMRPLHGVSKPCDLQQVIQQLWETIFHKYHHTVLLLVEALMRLDSWKGAVNTSVHMPVIGNNGRKSRC